MFGVGPHTISVPRICPADDIDPGTFSNAVPDDVFLKIVALIRLAVPYTGMIMSTRESARIRAEALKLGVSQISGGSRTSVGGYTVMDIRDVENTAQFDTNDRRTLDEVVCWLLENGYLPSFCTACYRAGRTGDRFMEFAKNGGIAMYCQANAIMTLKEYLCDYAKDRTLRAGQAVIDAEIPKIMHEKVREASKKRLIRIEQGERDFRF
jgi:2-iminoacetate synthase